MTLSIVPSLIKSYKGKNIRINPVTKYVCLSDMASAAGKLVADWLRLNATSKYLSAFEGAMGIPIAELLEVSDGNSTWAHQKIAIRFAQWCSPEFAIQVDFWIDELLTTGSVSIAHQPQRQLAPQRDVIDYIEAANLAGVLDDPHLKALIAQRIAEQLGGKALAESQLVIATVRANELGYSQKQIGTGSALGTFVKNQGCEPIGKTYHGNYRVNTYYLTPELDDAIHLYFS
jgi:hypothetical protein